MNPERPAAISSTAYLVRWLLAVPEENRTALAGPGAQPWCELTERLTRSMGRDLRRVVVPLLSAISRQADSLTPEQRAMAGAAARRVLEFAWNDGTRDAGMIRCAICGVCRTFDSDPVASAPLLRRILATEHLTLHGFDELPTLVRDLGRLLTADPTLVEAVYHAAVSFSETDEAPTAIGGASAILPLRSNRRQDYRLGQHQLGELFPRFMEMAPVNATGAVIAAVEAEVAEHAVVPLDEIPGDVIGFDGGESRFAEDVSHIWDSTTHRHELPLQMLDGFEEELVRLAGPSGDAALLGQVLARVARENRFAAVWRRVLSAAIRLPKTLGIRVWALAASPPVLLAGDTVELVGRYLQAVFPLLGRAEREAIERAILSLRTADPEDVEFFAHRRDRLLGCVGLAHAVTAEAAAALRELETAGGPPPNTPLFEMGEVTCEAFTETQWLVSQGVEVEAEPNRRLRELTDPVVEFTRQATEQGGTQTLANAVLPVMRQLREMLHEGVSAAHSRMVESSTTHLAASCSTLAGAEWLESDPEVAGFVRSVLLEAAGHELPRPDPTLDQHYEQHAVLSMSPRFHAADGLPRLLRFPTLAGPEVVGAIDHLAEDPRAEIRSAVVRHIAAIHRYDIGLFWKVLRRTEGAESSRRIIHYALVGAHPFTRQHRGELLGLAHTVFRRFRGERSASEVRCACLGILLTGNAFSEDPYGGELIRTVVSDMATFTAEALYLVQTAAEFLTAGPVAPSDPYADRHRLASFAFLEGIGRAVREWLTTLEVRLRGLPREQWPADATPQLEAVQQVAHRLGTQTYFASGTFNEKMGRESPRRGRLGDAGKRRFLREGLPLLRVLAEFGIPDVVHHCLETLVAYVAVDPRSVFLAAVEAVRHGQRGGYQDDSLAVNLVVGLVRRYLADHRSLFRDDVPCREALVEVLNIFIRAGWPEAIELTSRLDEIYR